MSGGRGRTAWTAPPGGHCLPALRGLGRAVRRPRSVRPAVGERHHGRPTPPARASLVLRSRPDRLLSSRRLPAWPGLPPRLEGTERD